MTIVIIVVAVILVLVFVLRSSGRGGKSSDMSNVRNAVRNAAAESDKNVFSWAVFKNRKPAQARAIETLIGRDLSQSNDTDAFEIVSTLQRWSENAGVPISQLKENFLNGFKELTTEMDEEFALDRIKNEIDKEAKHFNISRDNTISSFMLKWAKEAKNRKGSDTILRNIAKNMNIPESEMDDFVSSVRNKEKELNIAPDITDSDGEENRLISLAEEGVDFISENFKKLNKNGRIEALIYCTTCLIKLPTNYGNELDLEKKEDRYFLLLHDKIFGCVDDVPSFINSRIRFYNEQKRKLAESPMYTPMFIFNAFYMNQLCEHPEVLKEFNESPIELIMMNAILKELNNYFSQRLVNI